MRAVRRRWVAGTSTHPHQDAARRAEVAQTQDRFAVGFSCIDSRVAPEPVFDTGWGEPFVLRTAGQTIDPLVMGPAEYAELGTRASLCSATSAAAPSPPPRSRCTPQEVAGRAEHDHLLAAASSLSFLNWLTTIDSGEVTRLV
ncbi:carbonic anhydrase [Nonomuraea turkmeniaca]|uniref:carbonic anhydrase n=1 Tax=Nonomuraea turkmeniaca TaxID=103838 RepID=UPI0014768605|nr:carbonic anhydrase [Nonomuraea turkmeniaca]